MDKSPELLSDVFCHEHQRDNIEGEQERDVDTRKAVFGGHVSGGAVAWMGHLISHT